VDAVREGGPTGTVIVTALNNIENIQGGKGNDILYGNEKGNIFFFDNDFGSDKVFSIDEGWVPGRMSWTSAPS